LAILRGRFDQASALIKDVHASGHRAGVPDTNLPDTDLLTETLHGAISMERDPVTEGPRAAEALLAAARHRPGHYFEATAALVLLGIGREAEARSELDRVLPRVLTGSGPRWLGATADLAAVAAASLLTLLLRLLLPLAATLPLRLPPWRPG
jgi:hypothetical protein